jgi:AraC-like DNA-binding protein
VRRYVTSLPEEQTGWLAGLRHRHVGRALNLLHGQPAFAWTLESLAEDVGLSRSALSERFDRLDCPSSHRDMIYHGNAERLLSL